MTSFSSLGLDIWPQKCRMRWGMVSFFACAPSSFCWRQRAVRSILCHCLGWRDARSLCGHPALSTHGPCSTKDSRDGMHCLLGFVLIYTSVLPMTDDPL